MKKIFTIAICLFVAVIANGQEVTFEKLDSVSNYISKKQFELNVKSYSENNKTTKISFSEENFTINYSDLLATASVYKMTNNIEMMELVENIDLSKVTAIKIISLNYDLQSYQLSFPNNSIELQVYEDGVLKEKRKVSEIYLYGNDSRTNLFNEIVQICHILKKKKKVSGSEYNNPQMSKDWYGAKLANTVTVYDAFLNKYPNSLYNGEINVLLNLKKKQIQEEKDRLEKIRLEKLRLEQEAEKERIRLENERLAKLAEIEARKIGFFGFRVGYVIPTDENSQKLSGSQGFGISPYETGQFGLKAGFNAGFTGVINLEFINKNLPEWIGLGIPIDFNIAMMQYNWDDLPADNINIYTAAKYSLRGIASVGAGLSLTFHPAKKLFIDVIARPDYYGNFGGNYKATATSGPNVNEINTERAGGEEGDSFGLAKAIGLNLRYKSIMFGFEMKTDIVDEAKFNRLQNGATIPVINNGLNLDNMQFTFGYIF